MIYKRFFFALLFLFFACASAFAQRDTVSLNTILTKSVKYSNDYPIEKIYVHFDKPYYAAGDTIWFKVYATVDIHLPSQLSKIAYVDLYNDQDSLTTSLKLPLVNGVAPGMIALPRATFRQGNYRLRAYTNWMMNFDASYLFTKVITIGNAATGDIQTNIKYNTTAGTQPTVSARIQFKDGSGKPYADKKVSWRMESGHEDIGKGKGTTDANGYMTVSLPPTPSITLSGATLFTVLDNDAKSYTSTFSLKSAAPNKDLQFFPEGGQLIAGLEAKIALKAIKADGLGIDVKGTITDNAGQTAGTFTSQHLGMGVFTFIPEAGKTYKAAVTFADGTQGSYDLPKIQTSGIALTVTGNNDENLSIRVATSEAYFKANQNKSFYVIAQSGGFIRYAAMSQIDKQLYLASIPKTKFQSGTIQLTLFGSNGYPISERMVFNMGKDLMNLNMTSDKPQYSRRQPVKLTVSAKNGVTPAEANLSVSVIDERKVPVDEDAETTILTNLLLTSDLKGYIEKPNYYFVHKDEKTAADLDVLMMTQGYRRFSFRDVLAGRAPKIPNMPEEGLVISGTLRNNTGLPIFKGNLRLTMSDRSTAMTTTTNAEGQFRFENVMASDSAEIQISARDNVNSNSLMLMIDPQRTPGATRIVNLPDERLNIDSAMRPYMDNSKKIFNMSRQLNEVVIRSANYTKPAGHLSHPSLTGLPPMADHLIDGSRFKGCTNFVSCLAGMALGMTYVDNFFYVTRNYNAGNKKPVDIYIDGLEADMSFLQTFDANDVESVELFLKDGLSGINQRNGTDGVLVINKKKAPKGQKITLADLQKMIIPGYIAKINARGYANVKEFYSPKYDLTKPQSGSADLRSTIYWNPKVATDKLTGNAVLQFNNADATGPGTYRAVVEGIDKDGNIGRFVYRYKIQ